MPTYAYLDDKGALLKTVTNFLGQRMITYTVSKDEAKGLLRMRAASVSKDGKIRLTPSATVLPVPHVARRYEISE